MYNFVEIIPRDSEIIGMMKSYASFSGEGPFPTELKEKEGELLSNMDYEHSHEAETKNRCGWLDLIILKKIIQENGITVLGITNLDVIGKFKMQYVCDCYEYHHRIYRNVPDELEDCHPLYHQFFGSWDMENCRQWKEVPDRAKYYMRYIERKLGIPVSYFKFPNQNGKVIKIDLTNRYYL